MDENVLLGVRKEVPPARASQEDAAHQWVRWLACFLAGLFLTAFFVGIQKGDYSQSGCFVVGVPLVVLTWAFWGESFSRRLEQMGVGTFLCSATILFFLSRVAWLISFATVPYADFATFDFLASLVSKYQPIDQPLAMHTLLPAWGYPLFLGIWYSLAGHSFFAGKLFNLLVGTASVPVLYKLAQNIGGPLAARIATMLFLLWPTQIMMSSVLASEHLAVLLIMAAFCFLTGEVEGHRMTNIALASLFIALAYVVRHVFLSSLAAALVFILLCVRGTRITKPASAATLLAGFVVIYALYLGGMTRVYHVTPVSQGLFNLLVGVNIEANGHWNQEDADKYFAHPSFEEANAFARREIVNRVSSNPWGTLGLMWHKALLTWSDGTYGFFWAALKVDESRSSTLWLMAQELTLRGLAHYFHVFMLVLGAFGFLSLVSRQDLQSFAPVLLVIFFGTLLHAIVETQSRYNFVMMPFLLIVAARGLSHLHGPFPSARPLVGSRKHLRV